MMAYWLRWLAAFGLTQMVEMGVYAQAHARPRPLVERLAIAFACSGITHPLVWFVIPVATEELLGLGWWSSVAVCETFAVLAEAVFLATFGVRNALLWALAANGASFMIGLFCYLRLGWE
jgi:hypothetical protein